MFVYALLCVCICSQALFVFSRLFEGDKEPQEEQQEEEELEDRRSLPPSNSLTYAATVALPSTPPSSTTLTGIMWMFGYVYGLCVWFVSVLPCVI